MFLFFGCGAPSLSTGGKLDPLIKAGILSSVQSSINKGDCVGAYTIVQPVYASANSDNDIRLAMASVYGCYSKVNVFKNLSDLVSFNGDLGGSGLWTFFAQEYSSTANPDDKIPISAANGIDAIYSVIKPGTILETSSLINSTSSNPGSLSVQDRTTDANVYLSFLSMALMGSLLSRYGVNNKLPWLTPAQMKGDACAFVSGLLNYIDSLKFIQSVAPAAVGAKLLNITTLLGAGMDASCALGCTACGGSVSCSNCPTNLRDRTSCTGTSTDVNSCAGLGVILFVNSSW